VPIYSVGKNEIRNLLDEEKRLEKELRSLVSGSAKSNVSQFKAILLNNEITRVKNKLKVLAGGKSFDGGNIA
jgi:hypothetical protein